MTLVKLYMLIFLLFILLACNQTSKQSDTIKKTNVTDGLIDSGKNVFSSVGNSNVEEKIIDTIFKLTEVKERAKYIENETKGKRHLKIWVESTPNLPDQKYYWIKVGEENEINLVTHFNFYVYPDSMKIMYYDTPSDSELTLDRWRKLNSKYK